MWIIKLMWSILIEKKIYLRQEKRENIVGDNWRQKQIFPRDFLMEKLNDRFDYVYVLNRRTFVWVFSYMSEKKHLRNWTSILEF